MSFDKILFDCHLHLLIGLGCRYGGPSPRVGGSVVLSLYRMDRILEVDEKAAYAVVEPGVTFFDLYHHCRKFAPTLWPSCPSIAWGSVIGNVGHVTPPGELCNDALKILTWEIQTLDRGFGYTAQGNHQGYICGMEVMLPDGNLIPTGQWAVDNSPSAFACRAGFGPQVDGLFLQSNLGVVTKLGIWVQPQPDTMMPVCLEMDELEDLQDLVDILAELRREDILQNDPSIFNVFRSTSRMGSRHQVYPDPGAIPEDALQAMMKENGWKYWKTRGSASTVQRTGSA